MLKNAARLWSRCRIEAGTDPFGPYDNKFPGLYIAHVLCADQVEGAGLGGEDYGVALLPLQRRDASHGKRTEAARVADRKDSVIAHHHERKGPIDPA